MEREVLVRPADIEDLDNLVKVENEAWPEEQAFTKDHFEAHLEIFQNFPGIQVAVVDNEIAGIGVAEILEYDLDNPIPSWYLVTDDGFLRKTHNPAGNVLYGVSLSVSPRFSSAGVGRKIIEAAKNIVVQYHLERFILGSRVPRFHRYHTHLSIEEYVYSKKGSRFLDPEIEFYNKCGLEIVKILPDYFEDPMSLNYGVLVSWENS